MAGVPRDSFLNLERRWSQLEQNVFKLQASLYHWQAWEIEYEGLKEEVLGLGKQCSQADLVQSLHRHTKYDALTFLATGELGTESRGLKIL